MTDERWEDRLREVDAILVPGGFGKRGLSGMIRAIGYARARRRRSSASASACSAPRSSSRATPAGLDRADSTEFDRTRRDAVIFKLRDLLGVENLAGRCGSGPYPCRSSPVVAEDRYGAEKSRATPPPLRVQPDLRGPPAENASSSRASRPTGSSSRSSSWPTTPGSSAASSTRAEVEAAHPPHALSRASSGGP